jgi:hypothetical protein
MSTGIITPGPTVLLALNNAIRFGIKRAAYGICGAFVADVFLVTFIALGMGTLLATSETLFVTPVGSSCSHGCGLFEDLHTDVLRYRRWSWLAMKDVFLLNRPGNWKSNQRGWHNHQSATRSGMQLTVGNRLLTSGRIRRE